MTPRALEGWKLFHIARSMAGESSVLVILREPEVSRDPYGTLRPYTPKIERIPSELGDSTHTPICNYALDTTSYQQKSF